LKYGVEMETIWASKPYRLSPITFAETGAVFGVGEVSCIAFIGRRADDCFTTIWRCSITVGSSCYRRRSSCATRRSGFRTRIASTLTSSVGRPVTNLKYGVEMETICAIKPNRLSPVTLAEAATIFGVREMCSVAFISRRADDCFATIRGCSITAGSCVYARRCSCATRRSGFRTRIASIQTSSSFRPVANLKFGVEMKTSRASKPHRLSPIALTKASAILGVREVGGVANVIGWWTHDVLAAIRG